MDNNLMIKEIKFNGDTLMAAQDKTNEKVYVGVSWVCEGIGLTENQKDRQVKNIQSDIVISNGSKKLSVKFDGQVREVLCIELDFLPLWLAKISITPKMQKDSPETVNKLVEYQLKAKEVLANAFVHNVTQIIPRTYKEALLALIDAEEVKEKLEAEKQILLPKAESYDTFIDASNYQKMNDVAKSLGYGRNKLFALLRDKKILMVDNLPYQRFIDSGHFVVKENTIQNGAYFYNHSQTYVTPKGVDYISKLLKDNKIKETS